MIFRIKGHEEINADKAEKYSKPVRHFFFWKTIEELESTTKILVICQFAYVKHVVEVNRHDFEDHRITPTKDVKYYVCSNKKELMVKTLKYPNLNKLLCSEPDYSSDKVLVKKSTVANNILFVRDKNPKGVLLESSV